MPPVAGILTGLIGLGCFIYFVALCIGAARSKPSARELESIDAYVEGMQKLYKRRDAGKLSEEQLKIEVAALAERTRVEN